MQAQADISGIKVDRPAMRETTALGAAIAAGLAVGVWDGEDEVMATVGQRGGRTIFEPQMDKDQAGKLFNRWEKAVQMSRGWARDEAKATH
jgi:glycerol kinase